MAISESGTVTVTGSATEQGTIIVTGNQFEPRATSRLHITDSTTP